MGKSSRYVDANGWTWTFRKNNASFTKPVENPYQKDVEKVASSFYVTNFPESLDPRGIWKICAPYGRLVDTFIANKCSKRGKRFGFIRFLGVKDVDVFGKSLSNIWIGNFHLFVTVAKFQRTTHVEPKSKQNANNFNVSLGDDNFNPKINTPKGSDPPLDKSSFVSIVHGLFWLNIKEVDTMSNMYSICKNEGFTDLKIHHVGGLWVWIQFPSVASCLSFQSNECMKRIAISFKNVSPSFKVDECMIWVEISGLPLCAWGSNAFKKIACMFGKFMFFEVDQSAAMSMGRVCISTKSQKFVSERVHAIIHGELFEEAINDPLPQTSKEEVPSDLSCPPGFEQLKNTNKCRPHHASSSRTSKCSTSFAKYRKKDIKGISLIHEMSRIIEVGGSLGFDVRGCQKSLNKLINGIGIQESKMTRLEVFRLKTMWGNYSFDFTCSLARGRSGGLISIWDPNLFVKESIWCDEAFIIVKGRWKNSGGDCYMINIYGPHDPVAKVSLWNKIREFMQSHMGKYVLFGDMNEVRNEHERHGSIFSRSEADFFSSFINNVGLIELPMGGRLFTWMNKADVIEELPDMRVTALDRLWSDHNPILLHCNKADFGPAPFKLCHSWILRECFNDFISLEWANIGQNEIMSVLKQLEEKIEAGSASPNDREKRIKLIQEADSLERLEAMDTTRTQSINGIMIEGVWVSDPHQIKEAFLNFFKDKFQACDSLISFPSISVTSGIQESKMTRLEVFRLKTMWGNYSFDFACSLARGRSGGLISIWDPNLFVKESIWCDEAFIIVKGRWKNSGGDCYMINIYGPHDPVAKVSLWNKIREFMKSHMGKYVLFGDMNEVRNEHERHDVIEELPDMRVTALDRLWSDHNPILLHCNKADFGPAPFKLCHSWILRECFNDFISLEWANIGQNVDGINILSHEKLKRLKVKIKQWIANSKSRERIHKQEIISALKQLEEKIEAGSASPDDREKRIKLIQEADSEMLILIGYLSFDCASFTYDILLELCF
ncbi:RNA-directed DNA polymerase, eukaryota, Reverse transcriptase zinc-binding domain protein [Artemisia annua]|uniref:RNA-directed DNA polymerase, eukaryota, Reverse transcriptase zinc-binding domain protein n=1 Tax=Artemisia annua TaxID=35608 RepID=A0A2U1QC24_ARTAN|nr:RNA-directed DNA polymerase, eukaryota, Reverse transcriptase zinc-binding domain protein [Artemisia annua]